MRSYSLSLTLCLRVVAMLPLAACLAPANDDAAPIAPSPPVMSDADAAIAEGGDSRVENACSSADTGAAGSDCALCGGAWIDRSIDEHNCGACGVVCDGSESCARGACVRLTLASLCALPMATVLEDDGAVDSTAADSLAVLLEACTPSVRVSTLPQTNARASGVLDPTTYRPTLGRGDLLVLAGSGARQYAVEYLEEATTPVYFRGGEGQYAFARRATGEPIVSVCVASVTEHHDWFVTEVVTELESRTTALVSYGFGAGGTGAAAWWLRTLADHQSTCCSQWYVVEWTDEDGDALPGPADVFTVVASG